VLGDDGRVVAVDPLAAAAGIRPGMRRGEAEGICPTVVTLRGDPGAEAVAFEAVVAAVEEVLPRVEVNVPGLLLAPVSGAVRYYGGETPLVERIVAALDPVTGPGYRIGLAAGPFAARCAAERTSATAPVHVVADDAAFRAGIDVAALGAEDLVATFRWLGITTLGALARLPRAALVSRFGSAGLAAHRLASGEDRSTRPREILEIPEVTMRFDPPLGDLERVSFAARRAAGRLVARLAATGTAAYRVRIEVEAADGSLRSRRWGSRDPFDDRELAERVRWQLRAWMEGTTKGMPGGIVVLRLVPEERSDSGRQLGLREEVRARREAERALAEVETIVGPDRVLRARPQGGRDPAERVQWYRWNEDPGRPERDPGAPWPGRIPPPTPMLVPPAPRPWEVEWEDGFPVRVRLGSRWEPVRAWAGPWRRMGRWWRGEPAGDRYQLVTSAGAFLCEVREGRTFLLGIYD